MGTFRVSFDNNPADDMLINAMGSLEVEENADLPGAVQLTLPVNSDGDGDLTYVNDSRFQPFVNVAVVVTPKGKPDECIFDGYILSSKLRLQKGTVGSVLQIWGQDASWLMNLDVKVKEWVDVTDAEVASSIFADYGIVPADDNSRDDSPTHTEDQHTLMQCATDIQFLRNVARRTGKLCRVTCADQPGMRTGYFAKPSVQGTPVLTLDLNDPETWMVDTLDFSWDVTHPSKTKARQALFSDTDADGVCGDQTDSGLDLLAERGLSDFAGKTMSVFLTATVDDADELTMRAQSVLRESGWFVRCEGEVDAVRLQAILRVGTVVMVNGAGSLNSGKYFVWSVRHTIGKGSHMMKFVLLRNAVGSPPQNSAGELGAQL